MVHEAQTYVLMAHVNAEASYNETTAGLVLYGYSGKRLSER